MKITKNRMKLYIIATGVVFLAHIFCAALGLTPMNFGWAALMYCLGGLVHPLDSIIEADKKKEEDLE